VYAQNEILFPPHVIPRLRRARGERWRELVDRVAGLPQDHPESLAFSLMMIRLDGCLGCETDSFRAMKGCATCALQVLHRYKAADSELLQRYSKALHDVEAFLVVHPLRTSEEVLVSAKAA